MFGETPNVAIDYSVNHQRDELQSLELIDRIEGARRARVGLSTTPTTAALGAETLN